MCKLNGVNTKALKICRFSESLICRYFNKRKFATMPLNFLRLLHPNLRDYHRQSTQQTI